MGIDAYSADGFDFTGTRACDARTGYRSISFLSVPLKTRAGTVIGVLQLINAGDAGGHVVPFDPALQPVVEALASQASVALENQRLLQNQRELFDSLVRMLAAAIDAKSPYTGAHCQRVPVIYELLADAACESREGVSWYHSRMNFDRSACAWRNMIFCAMPGRVIASLNGSKSYWW